MATAASSGNNRNVRLGLAFTFLGAAARGVWSFSTLSNYLQGMTGSVLSVGAAEGVQGIAQALVALLAGWYADKFARDVVLKFAGLIGIVTIAFLMVVLLVPGWDFHNPGDPVWAWMDASVRYPLLVAALAFWGAYQGVWNTSLETIFADSVPMGQRSFYNTRKFVLLQLASISGPVMAIVLFLVTGNNWGQHTLTTVFVGGLLATLPSILCLFFFRDDLALAKGGASARDANRRPVTAAPAALPVAVTSASAAAPGGGRGSRAGVGGAAPGGAASGGAAAVAAAVLPRHEPRHRGGACGCCCPARYVPHVIIGSDLVSGFGSGMTVKFFPLFFSQKLKLSPISTNTIYIIVPLFMTCASLVAQKLSRRYGRIQVSMLYAYIGAVALVGMWILGRLADDDWTQWSLGEVLPLYFISTAQHCVRPLKKSILMDFIKQGQRGRWNSLDSVTRFGWSGSAVVGGWVVDHFNYGWSFLITAVIQTAAASMLLMLVRAVPAAERAGRAPSRANSRSRSGRSGLADPLLLEAAVHGESKVRAVVDDRLASPFQLGQSSVDATEPSGINDTSNEDLVRKLNSTWHGVETEWRAGTTVAEDDGRVSRSRPSDAWLAQDDSPDDLTSAESDALAEMQSPLMNAFVRRNAGEPDEEADEGVAGGCRVS